MDSILCKFLYFLLGPNLYLYSPDYYYMPLVNIRSIFIIFEHYSGCFHQSAWLLRYYHFLLSQYCSIRLKYTLEYLT